MEQGDMAGGPILGASDQEIRLRCLDLSVAVTVAGLARPDLAPAALAATVDRAAAFLAFVQAGNPDGVSREVSPFSLSVRTEDTSFEPADGRAVAAPAGGPNDA